LFQLIQMVHGVVFLGEASGTPGPAAPEYDTSFWKGDQPCEGTSSARKRLIFGGSARRLQTFG
jgi:hypothetical protein